MIVARRAFLTKVKGEPPHSETPLSFREIAKFAHTHPGKCKFYLGPAKSGTREVATTVLEAEGLSVADVATLGDLNFVEAAYALRTETLDVGFFMTTVDSPFIHDLLRHGDAALIGVHDAAGLVQSSDCLFTKAFKPGVVVDDTPLVPIETVAANSILICSATMPENDVYWLTKSVTDYLAEESIVAKPDASGKSAKENGAAETVNNRTLKPYPFHPGADAFHANRQPWYIIATENSVYWFR